MLGEGPTYGINGNFGSPKKKFILLKQTQNFVWVYIKMLIIAICLLMERKGLNLKLTIQFKIDK